MKFRPVREFLNEAMSEVVEIEPSKEALAEALNHMYKRAPDNLFKASELSLEHQGFDKRIGWDSYLVSSNGRACGYTDGVIP